MYAERVPHFSPEGGFSNHCQSQTTLLFGSPIKEMEMMPDEKLKRINPLAPEFRKNSFNPAGKLQLFRSVKLIEIHGIMKITKKFTLYKIE